MLWIPFDTTVWVWLNVAFLAAVMAVVVIKNLKRR